MRARGISCWMAPESVQPGSLWAAQVVQAIESSKAVVMVLSSGANRSVQIPREAELAISCRRTLIPYRIESVNPEGALRYFLGVTHWLDAFFPASVSPENLARLCDAVERAIHSHGPGKETFAVKGLLKEKASRNLRLRLAEEMIRQQQALISIDAFSDQDKKELEDLESLGHLVERPSFMMAAGNRFTTPARPEDCLDLLVEWLAEQCASPEQSLDIAAGFPLMFEAIAIVILDKPEEELEALIQSYVSIDRQEIEHLIQALVDRIDRPDLQSGTVCGQIHRIASLVLHHPALPAVRGLLIGAQRLISRSRVEPALVIYEQTETWAKESDANLDVKRILVETVNERARAEMRLGQSDLAERRLRAALEIAGCLEDPTLVGVLTNNLARALLEHPSSVRREEAIKILEDNLVRLADTPQREHLGAAYSNLGNALETTDPERAEECFRTDVRICRDVKDDPLTSDALHSLAGFLMNQGKYSEAVAVLQEELPLFERFFDPRRHARALANLGRAHLGCWKKSRDRRELEKALIPMLASKNWFLTCSGESRLFAPALENLGRVLVLLGRREEGLAALKDAMAQYRSLSHGGPIADEIEKELSLLETC